MKEIPEVVMFSVDEFEDIKYKTREISEAISDLCSTERAVITCGFTLGQVYSLLTSLQMLLIDKDKNGTTSTK